MPLGTNTLCEIHPEAFNATVMNTPRMWHGWQTINMAESNRPSPDVRTVTHSLDILHLLCNFEVLNTMITLNMAGESIGGSGLQKKVKDSLCAVVVTDPYTGDVPRLPINECMGD